MLVAAYAGDKATRLVGWLSVLALAGAAASAARARRAMVEKPFMACIAPTPSLLSRSCSSISPPRSRSSSRPPSSKSAVRCAPNIRC
jgi:hypothetical protein